MSRWIQLRSCLVLSTMCLKSPVWSWLAAQRSHNIAKGYLTVKMTTLIWIVLLLQQVSKHLFHRWFKETIAAKIDNATKLVLLSDKGRSERLRIFTLTPTIQTKQSVKNRTRMSFAFPTRILLSFVSDLDQQFAFDEATTKPDHKITPDKEWFVGWFETYRGSGTQNEVYPSCACKKILTLALF